MNNRGPSIEISGTPVFISKTFDFMFAHGLLRNSLIIVMLRIPTYHVNYFKKMIWSIVSNAFNESRNILMGNLLLSNCVVILSTFSRAAYSVEWFGQKPH